MELMNAIKMRRSTRSFTDKQVPKEDVLSIVDAGRYAPIGMPKDNPVHLSVVQDPALVRKISSSIATIFGDPSRDPYYGAQTIVVVSAPEKENHIEIANAGTVIQTMLLAATEKGVDNIYIWGIRLLADDAGLLKELGIPEGMKPISSMALGYATEKADTPRDPNPFITTSAL